MDDDNVLTEYFADSVNTMLHVVSTRSPVAIIFNSGRARMWGQQSGVRAREDPPKYLLAAWDSSCQDELECP